MRISSDDICMITVEMGDEIFRARALELEIRAEDDTMIDTMFGRSIVKTPRCFYISGKLYHFQTEIVAPMTLNTAYKNNSQWLWDFLDDKFML